MFRFRDRFQTSLRQLWGDIAHTEDLLSLLEQRDQDLEDYLAPGQWIAPTFKNGWVDFAAGNPPVVFRKAGDMVQIHGVAKSGTIGAAIFTLPPTLRPPTNFPLPVVSNNLFGVLVVAATGDVVAYAGSNVYFSVDCQFPVSA